MVGITRTDILNHLADTYRPKRYLEIGVQNTWQNFDKIRCEYKVCVDPDPAAGATFCMTSDQFFENEPDKFDLVFIDGLHHAEQVEKDFLNALKILSSNGFIVMHDCNPQKEEHTIVPRPIERGHWNGDVYRFAGRLSSFEEFATVDEDNGCGVFENVYGRTFPLRSHFDWQYFNKYRKELLNLITWDEFKLQFAGPHVQ